MAMKRVYPSTLRCAIASVLALGVAFVATVSANALPTYWDREDFNGSGKGWGVTAATANAAGVPIVDAPGLAAVPAALAIGRVLDPSTLFVPVPLGSGPATVTSTWTATNNTGSAIQNAYLVFARPETNTEHIPSVTYDPANVGLTLGANWVILKLDAAGIPVYYPAVSLGTLANGAAAAFPLFYTLQQNPPQVFNQPFNDDLGIPAWKLAFLTGTPIPEPSTGLLVAIGLLGIARLRRQHS